MAEISFLLGAAFLNQTTRGTFNTAVPDIAAGSGTGGAIENVTDGAVLGDADSGVGETGLSISLGKKITEKAVQTGSFTKDFANFVSRTIDAFSVTLPLKGNGETTTATPVAADFTPDIGIVALLRAAGLTGGASGATWQFAPASSDIISAGLYFGNQGSNGGKIEIKDVEARSLSLDFTPGEVAKATFDLAGVYDAANENGSWPAAPFEYGNQSTLSAPAVTGVGFTWGPDTPAARAIGFSDLTIAIDLESETIPSSNADSGEITRQTGRTISIKGTIDATDGEFLYELDQLGESVIGNAEALTFIVGTAATGSDTANAYQIDIPDPELVKLEPGIQGNSQAWTIELIARSATANGEFTLTFK